MFCCLLQSRSDYLFPALEATSELFLVLSRNMLGQRRLHFPQGVQVPYKTHGFAFIAASGSLCDFVEITGN